MTFDEMPFGQRLEVAWAATQAALPAGWRFESARCTSIGQGRRGSATWCALAAGPEGESVQGRGSGPLLAMADLIGKLAPAR